MKIVEPRSLEEELYDQMQSDKRIWLLNQGLKYFWLKFFGCLVLTTLLTGIFTLTGEVKPSQVWLAGIILFCILLFAIIVWQYAKVTSSREYTNWEKTWLENKKKFYKEEAVRFLVGSTDYKKLTSRAVACSGLLDDYHCPLPDTLPEEHFKRS